MSARDDLIDEYGRADTAPLGTLSELKQKLDAYRAEVLAGATNPGDAATIYAERLCTCDEPPHPTWCPASVPTDERITEIRDGAGDPLTPRELSWIKGAAARHELHVVGSRGGHWPLTDDLSGALLLVSQYLAAAVAVIERGELIEEEATAPAATATPSPTGRIKQLLDAIRTTPGVWTTGKAFQMYRLLPANAGLPLGMVRNLARGDLRLLAEAGHLTVTETTGRREYRLNTRKDTA